MPQEHFRSKAPCNSLLVHISKCPLSIHDFSCKTFCPGVLLSYSTSLHGHEMDNQLRSDPNQHKNWCYKVLHPLSSHCFYCFLKLLWLKLEKEKEFLDSSRLCLGVCLCVCFETLLSLSINNTVFILFCTFPDMCFLAMQKAVMA